MTAATAEVRQPKPHFVVLDGLAGAPHLDSEMWGIRAKLEPKSFKHGFSYAQKNRFVKGTASAVPKEQQKAKAASAAEEIIC